MDRVATAARRQDIDIELCSAFPNTVRDFARRFAGLWWDDFCSSVAITAPTIGCRLCQCHDMARLLISSYRKDIIVCAITVYSRSGSTSTKLLSFLSCFVATFAALGLAVVARVL